MNVLDGVGGGREREREAKGKHLMQSQPWRC